jgi:hypothetical protein
MRSCVKFGIEVGIVSEPFDPAGYLEPFDPTDYLEPFDPADHLPDDELCQLASVGTISEPQCLHLTAAGRISSSQ